MIAYYSMTVTKVQPKVSKVDEFQFQFKDILRQNFFLCRIFTNWKARR